MKIRHTFRKAWLDLTDRLFDWIDGLVDDAPDERDLYIREPGPEYYDAWLPGHCDCRCPRCGRAASDIPNCDRPACPGEAQGGTGSTGTPLAGPEQDR